MENLKDPGTIITLTNTAVLLGVSIYFYRQIKFLEAQVNKQSDTISDQSGHLTQTIKKIGDLGHMGKNMTKLAEAVKSLNSEVKNCHKMIQSLTQTVNQQKQQINQLQIHLQKSGVKITNLIEPPIKKNQWESPDNLISFTDDMNLSEELDNTETSALDFPTETSTLPPRNNEPSDLSDLGI
jgi:uncharacterized coiled-coil DUF342 family protein